MRSSTPYTNNNGNTMAKLRRHHQTHYSNGFAQQQRTCALLSAAINVPMHRTTTMNIMVDMKKIGMMVGIDMKMVAIPNSMQQHDTAHRHHDHQQSQQVR